jgi:hypothetical protein
MLGVIVDMVVVVVAVVGYFLIGTDWAILGISWDMGIDVVLFEMSRL